MRRPQSRPYLRFHLYKTIEVEGRVGVLRSCVWTLVFDLRYLRINLEGQPGPEGPKVNSHARKGVEQRMKLVLGPKDRHSRDGDASLSHLRRY